jgi:predicted nucleotidyltransferase
MLSRNDLELKLMQIKPILAERFHVSRIGYFGSFASGQQTENSDLDILVEFSQPIGLQFFTLEEYLEKQLGIKVDLVTENALKERIKKSILNQVHYV